MNEQANVTKPKTVYAAFDYRAPKDKNPIVGVFFDQEEAFKALEKIHHADPEKYRDEWELVTGPYHHLLGWIEESELY